MVIPKKIRIGGQDISVVNKERLDNDILGEICLAEGVLQIADTFRNIKQSESSKINTFIHEIVHGILDTMGEFKLSKNEPVILLYRSLGFVLSNFVVFILNLSSINVHTILLVFVSFTSHLTTTCAISFGTS